MNIQNFEKVKKAFNRTKPMRGQLVGIATADPDGNPNVAPVGSVRIVDEGTIHVLQGMLPRTMANLERNPRAAFSVWLRPTLGGIMKSVTGKEEPCMGYRVYGRLVEVVEDSEVIRHETEILLKRMPWFVRKPLREFFRKNLRKLLCFSIEEVREVR